MCKFECEGCQRTRYSMEGINGKKGTSFCVTDSNIEAVPDKPIIKPDPIKECDNPEKFKALDN